MEFTEAIQEIKQSKDILISELNNIGAYKHPRLKDKFNCPICKSKDNLCIYEKNGQWRAVCKTGCETLTNDTVIGIVSKVNNLEFDIAVKDIATRNGVTIDNLKLTNQQKKEQKQKKLEKQKDKIIKEIDNDIISEAKIKVDEMYKQGNTDNEEYYDNLALIEFGSNSFENHKKNLVSSLIYNKNGTIGINQLEAGESFLNRYKFINNDKFFYIYDELRGLWTKSTKQGIRTLITRDLKEACKYYSDGTTRSLGNYIFDMTYGNIEGETFDQVFNKDPYRIVFKNGTLNIKTNEFTEGFDPNDFNTIVIPHNYNENAKTPIDTINFLSMMTDDIEEITFIFQWIGYLLVKKYDIAKMLFLVGDGGNGKSTLIKLMTAIVGADNTSAVSMKSLITNKFQSSLLENRLFNTVADIGADFFDDSSILKALTGDDRITIERKGENGFQYLNFAKMTYSCNKLPKFKDTSGGLNRRPITLSLNKDFTNIVKDSGMNISDILNNKDELENILKYSIDKFREVLENGKNFTESESMIQTKIDWLSDDPLTDFIDETFEVVDNEDNLYTEMEQFMGLYKIYCTDRNYKPMSQKNIVEAIKNNKKFIEKNIDVKRLNSKTKKLKITSIIKVKENVEF